MAVVALYVEIIGLVAVDGKLGAVFCYIHDVQA